MAQQRYRQPRLAIGRKQAHRPHDRLCIKQRRAGAGFGQGANAHAIPAQFSPGQLPIIDRAERRGLFQRRLGRLGIA